MNVSEEGDGGGVKYAGRIYDQGEEGEEEEEALTVAVREEVKERRQRRGEKVEGRKHIRGPSLRWCLLFVPKWPTIC